MFYFSHTEIGVNREIFNHEHGVASACRSIADLIQVVTTSTSPVIAASGRSALVVKEPYCVVLGIFSPEHSPTSWRYGLACSRLLWVIPLCSRVPRLLLEPCGVASPSALHYAGLPAGCLNTLYHDPKDAGILTSKLIVHPAIKKINFTGSTRAGSIIAVEAWQDFSDTQGWDVAQLVSDVAVINNKKLITDALSKGVQLLADDMGHGI
ncbi:hypothetical protein CFAM422_006635 [Trichoderma lentiforme]|uniref:Aldehyde dehydrogenase domain-containing protein n=1 Tax=Trichoderma lentiforme TaxID=1567552 RepID=A0A9P4XEM2_9HYPO|nr:hypothetical protein CFAM422_006635 [Trichoderma lentiforme]